MDEKPKCSHDAEPIKPTQEDQAIVKKDLTLKDQSPTKTLEHPAYSEDQSTTPVILTVVTKDQPDYSKNESALTVNQPDVTEKDTGLSENHIVTRKHQSLLPEEQTTSRIHIDSAQNESTALKKENTKATIQMEASRELVVTPKVLITSAKEQNPFLRTDTGSMRNYSKNLDYALSLCAARLAPAGPSNVFNNDYLSSNASFRTNSTTPSLGNPEPMNVIPPQVSLVVETEPPSLFLQALSKLNDNSLTLAVISHFRIQPSPNMSQVYNIQSGDITPPDSLSSAPPTYSFVLRQLAIRRRPRFLGTFFPSPSFIQHTPPPTYTGAFDVYIEPALPPPPVRVYTFGFTSMPVICPECGYAGMTIIKCHVTYCTHMCACLLCLLCCWVCAPLPYVLSSCKDVYHYCRNCRSFLGMYCPNSHETVYPT